MGPGCQYFDFIKLSCVQELEQRCSELEQQLGYAEARQPEPAHEEMPDAPEPAAAEPEPAQKPAAADVKQPEPAVEVETVQQQATPAEPEAGAPDDAACSRAMPFKEAKPSDKGTQAAERDAAMPSADEPPNAEVQPRWPVSIYACITWAFAHLHAWASLCPSRFAPRVLLLQAAKANTPAAAEGGKGPGADSGKEAQQETDAPAADINAVSDDVAPGFVQVIYAWDSFAHGIHCCACLGVMTCMMIVEHCRAKSRRWPNPIVCSYA